MKFNFFSKHLVIKNNQQSNNLSIKITIGLDFFLIGPYGAFHCAQVYMEILPGFKGRVKVSHLATDLDKVTLLCKLIR